MTLAEANRQAPDYHASRASHAHAKQDSVVRPTLQYWTVDLFRVWSSKPGPREVELR